MTLWLPESSRVKVSALSPVAVVATSEGSTCLQQNRCLKPDLGELRAGVTSRPHVSFKDRS